MVKVHPKSRHPGLRGTAPSANGARLRIGVSEAAADGRANRAACAVLAGALKVPVSAVTIVSGATSREKMLHIDGDMALLTARLEAL